MHSHTCSGFGCTAEPTVTVPIVVELDDTGEYLAAYVHLCQPCNVRYTPQEAAA